MTPVEVAQDARESFLNGEQVQVRVACNGSKLFPVMGEGDGFLLVGMGGCVHRVADRHIRLSFVPA